MKVRRSKYHKYLGMALDYLNKGGCCVTICNYLDEIIDTFDEAVKKHRGGWILVKKQCLTNTSAHDNLVADNEECKKISTNAVASVHTIVANVMYVSKQV